MDTPAVTHNKEKENFTLVVDGAEAILEYHLSATPTADDSAGFVNFARTYVPPEFRGRGLAESLVRTGIGWAKDEGYDITASCWYVQKFIQ
jgi:predicted GNAT family acetyltransferase